MAASRPLLSPPTFVSPQNGGHHSSGLMNPSSDSDHSTASSSKRLSNYATVRGLSNRRHTAPHPPTPLQLSMKNTNDATTKATEDDDWTPFQQYSSPKAVPQLESRGSKSQIFSRPAPAYTSTNRPLSSHSTIGASASSSPSSRTPLSPHLFVNDEQVRLRHLKQPQHTHSSPGSTASSPRSSSSLPPPTNMLTAPTSQRRSSTSFYASSSAQPAYSSSSAVYVRHGCHSASLSTHEGGKEEENKKTKKKSKSIVILRRSPRGQQEEEKNKKKKGGSTRAWSPTTPNNNTSNHFNKEEQQKEKEKQKEKAAEDAVEARGEESWRRTMTEKEREEWVKRQQEGKTKLTREQKKALKDAEKLKKKMEKLKLQQKMNAK